MIDSLLVTSLVEVFSGQMIWIDTVLKRQLRIIYVNPDRLLFMFDYSIISIICVFKK